MRRSLECLFAGLLCVAAFAQSNEWRSWMERGNDLRSAGNPSEAITAYREAVRAADESGNKPLNLVAALNALAVVEDDLDRLSDAEQHDRRALTILEREVGERSVARAQVLVNLSGIYVRRGQAVNAEAVLREALAIYHELAPASAMLIAVAETCLGEALLSRSAYQEAESLVVRSLKVFEENPQTRKGYFGMGLINLGTIRQAQGRQTEALEIFARALATLEREMGAEHPVLLYSLNCLGIGYVNAGRYQEATAAFQRGLAIAETHLGKSHYTYGLLLKNYAECLKRSGHKTEAKGMDARANAVLAESGRINGTGMTVDVSAFRPH